MKYDFDSIVKLGSEKYGPAWYILNLTVMEKLWYADIEINNDVKTTAVLVVYSVLESINNEVK
jgi:hypothetical protein